MKKNIFAIICMFFVACTFILTGCSNKGLTDNPSTDANVVSNGGMTVVKEDYLYYVNGYVDETTLDKNDNKFGSVTNSAIYRTKLVNGEIEKDKDGFVVKTECVVPKVVGFSNGGFYIIDDYIYYATPYMKLSSDGVLQSSRVEFHRIDIDGTDDKVIYVTSENEDDLDWSVYKIDGTVYLTTYCASKIISVNTETNKVMAEVENSTSYAILKETDYSPNAQSTELRKYIYFTRSISSDDNLSGDYKGNIICKLNIATGEVSIAQSADKDYTYTIKHVDANNIYYTKKNSTYSGNDLLHKRTLEGSFVNATEVKLSNVAYTNYYFCSYGDNLVIATTSDATWLIEGGVSKQIQSSAKTILGIYGSYAYYVEESNLYRFKVRGEVVNGSIATELACDDSKTYTITNKHFLDFDNKRLYVYTEYTSASENTSYYLNYINENGLSQRFVGEFEEDHLPAVPDQDEDYGEDPDVEYIPHID